MYIRISSNIASIGFLVFILIFGKIENARALNRKIRTININWYFSYYFHCLLLWTRWNYVRIIAHTHKHTHHMLVWSTMNERGNMERNTKNKTDFPIMNKNRFLSRNPIVNIYSVVYDYVKLCVFIYTSEERISMLYAPLIHHICLGNCNKCLCVRNNLGH